MNNLSLKSDNSVVFKTASAHQAQADNYKSTNNIPLPDVQIPDLYYTPKSKRNKKSFKEVVKQWDFFNIIHPWLTNPLLMLGACGVMGFGVDKFAEGFGGEYNKSIVGRAANLGDKITNSSFTKSKPIQTVFGWCNSIKTGIAKIFKDSDLIKAIKNTPSKPEWPMVKDELLSMEQRIVRDFTEITKELKLTTDGAVELNKLNIGKKEKEFFKNFFGNSKVTDEIKSNALQLKNLGLKDDAIKNIINGGDATNVVKSESLKKLGLTAEKVGMDLNSYFEKLATGNVSKKDVEIIREACHQARGISVSEGYKSWLGPLQFLKRKISVDEVANRLVSLDKGKTSKLGRMFSSLIQKCHRGFTFGGGKTMVLFFVTPFLVDTIVDVKNANKDEKVGTAAHGLVHSMSWVFTFPLALKIMHHLGGAQYAGMSAEKVAEYRGLINAFNKEVADGTFANHDAYKKALKELKTKLNALKVNKGQNLLTKTGKKLGSILTMDLENVAAYQGKNQFMNLVRKIPSFFRNLGGVPMRLAIWMGISMGVLDTLINKCLKGLFGNYYDRYKVEDEIARKKEQKNYTLDDLQARLLELQKQKVYKNNALMNNQNLASPAPAQNGLENPIMKSRPKANGISENINAPQPIVIEPTEINNFTINQNGEITKVNSSLIAPQTNKNLNSQTNETPKLEDVSSKNFKPDYIPNQKAVVKDPVTRNQDNYTYIPSSKNVIKPEKTETETNKYIPSQLGAKIDKSFDNSGLDAALKRADRAEKVALQTLAGKFNGI